MNRFYFKTTASDYVAVQSFITRRINKDIRDQKNKGWLFKIKSVLAGIILSIIFLLPLMLFIVNNPASLNLYVGYLFAVSLLLLFLGKLIYRKNLIKLMEAKLINEESSCVTIGEHGVENYDQTSHTVYKWQAIKSVDHWGNYILFLTPLYTGIFLPDRAFESQEEMQNFLNEARRFLSLASNKGVDADAVNNTAQVTP